MASKLIRVTRTFNDCLESSSSHKQVNNENYEHKTADATPNHGTAIIVTAASPEKQQQNQNDQK